MILYDNQKRAQDGGELDQVYTSNPNRFTHETQALYLKKLAEENIFSPNLTQNITCLDIGCGQGALLDILYNILLEKKEAGLTPSNFYGLDVSEVGITQANINYPQYQWIIDSFQEFCTVGSKKFNLDGSFSIILNRGGLTSLQSMDEYEAMLQYVDSLLSENGIYFFSQNVNYYRIWMNSMLNARSEKLKPIPSIFKMNNTLFECVQFYRLPGDYIGVYRKRKSASLIPKHNEGQKSLMAREPFAVTFNMSDGRQPTLFISGDDVAKCFLTKYILTQQEINNFSFDVPRIYPEERMKTEYELCALAKSINANSENARFFVSSFNVNSLTTRAITIMKDLFMEKWEDAKFIYFPRRFITVRDICRFYPEIRSSLPDVILLGIGLEDHRFENECPHPLVDIGEYTNRLDWLFDTLIKDNIRPIWCLTRFEETCSVQKYFYLSSETKKYNKIECELCEKYGIMMVDFRDLAAFNNAKLRKETIFRLSAAIKSVKSEINALPLHTEIKAEEKSLEYMPYVLPFSGTLIFDDGTSQFLSFVEAGHLYASTPDLIYREQLNSDGYDVGMISGVDFYSFSHQAKHCLQVAKSHVESLADVLILGDSIRMRIRDLTGYGQKAALALRGQVNMLHIGENFGGTKAQITLISNIVRSSMKPTVVHVNAGLHDVMNDLTGKYPAYCDINTYAENVKEMIRKLKSISSVKTIIWATMTPIHPEWHEKKPDGSLSFYTRSQADIIAYNARAVEVARSEGVWVNDLYAVVQEAGLEKCILRDGVHLSDYGTTLLGEVVASKIKEALNA